MALAASFFGWLIDASQAESFIFFMLLIIIDILDRMVRESRE